VEGPRCGREKTRIKVGEHLLSRRELTDKKESPDFKVTRVSGVQSVSMLFEGDSRSVEDFRGPSQIAGGERDFGFGYDASCAGDGFFGTEAPRSFPQKLLRSCEVAKLSHGDPTERKRRRIIAQRDSFQRSQGIAYRKRASCSCDQRVHLNPDTLVTPTPQPSRAKYSAWQSNTKSHRERDKRK
jgi:hypothetical protein